MDLKIGVFGAIAALVLSACSGAPEDEGTGTPNAQGSGATAGTSTTSPEPEPVQPVSLSDWPWSLSGPGHLAGGGQMSAADGVLTLTFADSATRTQLQTHHHVDFVETFGSLHFEATASRSAVLLVAFAGLSASKSDYWSDLAAGSPWLAVQVTINEGTQSIDVSLDGLAAQGPGTPRPTFDEMGSIISFVIDDPSSLELSLSNIRLE